MRITVQAKNIYGAKRYYPICPKAKLFCKMLQTVTLSRKAMSYIEELGYKIEIQVNYLFWD